MTKGSHGHMNKSGRVRELTPKVARMPHVKVIPRLRNKRNYLRRVVQGQDAGQPKERRRR